MLKMQESNKKNASDKTEQARQVDPSELKTNVDKARHIFEMKYSERALSTLERLSTQELDFILENKRDPAPDEFDKNNAKFAKELVNNVIQGLESIYEARGETGGLNKATKAFTLSQAECLAPYLNSNKAGIVGVCFLAFGLCLLSIQAVWGFDNFKKWIRSFWNDDAKSSKNNHTQKAS